jgi:hypothetical protein
MVDLIHLQQDRVDNIVAHQLKVVLVQKVCHVFFGPREKIVQADHLQHRSDNKQRPTDQQRISGISTSDRFTVPGKTVSGEHWSKQASGVRQNYSRNNHIKTFSH